MFRVWRVYSNIKKISKIPNIYYTKKNTIFNIHNVLRPIYKKPSQYIEERRKYTEGIEVFDTPNPTSKRFQIPYKLPLEKPIQITNQEKAMQISDQATTQFKQENVQQVMLADTYVVVIAENADNWQTLLNPVVDLLTEYNNDNPIVNSTEFNNTAQIIQESNTMEAREAETSSNEIEEQKNIEVSDETEEQIRDIVVTRIQPALAEDGGSVDFIKFENGIVWLRMQGACSGCPSSGDTLKQGIESMLRYYVPEVIGVEEWDDETM